MEQTHKSTLRVLLIAGNSVLGCFFFGYCLGYMGVSFDTIAVVFGITENVEQIKALINCLLPFGAGFGAFGTGLVLQVLRRKNALMLNDLIGIIGVALGLFNNIFTLCVSRFILGLAVGLNSALIPLYIKEYTPIQLRGVAGSLNQITVNTGIQISYFLGLNYPSVPQANNTYWRVVFGLPLVFCVIRSFILQFVYNDDPPSYYIEKGDQDKAQEVLQNIYKQDYVQEQLDELQLENKQKAGSTSKFSDFFKKLYRSRLIVGCLLCVLQQFCGINSVIFYSTDIFAVIFGKGQTAQWLTIGVGLTNIVFSMVAGYLMKSYGRKQLLFIGNVLCFLCLLALTILSYINKDFKYGDQLGFLQIMIIILIYLYLIGFQLSLGPITWIYIADILPEKGISLVVPVNWLCVTLITYGFPIIADKSITICFGIFSMTCFLGNFMIYFLVKETRGKSAKSIEKMFIPENALLQEKVKSNNVVDDDTADW